MIGEGLYHWDEAKYRVSMNRTDCASVTESCCSYLPGLDVKDLDSRLIAIPVFNYGDYSRARDLQLYSISEGSRRRGETKGRGAGSQSAVPVWQQETVYIHSIAGIREDNSISELPEVAGSALEEKARVGAVSVVDP